MIWTSLMILLMEVDQTELTEHIFIEQEKTKSEFTLEFVKECLTLKHKPY